MGGLGVNVSKYEGLKSKYLLSKNTIYIGFNVEVKFRLK